MCGITGWVDFGRDLRSERATIEAAVSGSTIAARKAMLLNPAIGEWEPSEDLLQALHWPPS